MIAIRPAQLDDTQGISALFRQRITVWQRLNAAGRVEDVDYATLTIYERWLHGGPWMSAETAAIHLSRLLCGAGLPLVMEIEGQLVAYAEAYHGQEPEPFGNHLHIGEFIIDQNFTAQTLVLQTALMQQLGADARPLKATRVTINGLSNDADGEAFLARFGLNALQRIKRYTLSAKSGQGFYRVTDHAPELASQINQWFMPVGRLNSARQQWETLFPRTWHAIPEMKQRPAHRLHITAAGQEALVFAQPPLYMPRAVEIYLWSPKPLTSQMMTALRDWAHRENYRSLILPVSEASAAVLGNEAEWDGYTLDVYGVTM